MDIERILSANPNLTTPGGIRSAIKKERGTHSEGAITLDGERGDRSGYHSNKQQNEEQDEPTENDSTKQQLDPKVGGHLDVRV